MGRTSFVLGILILCAAPVRSQQDVGAEPPDRFCILFLDIDGIPEAEVYAEGELLARSLRYELGFDYTYQDLPLMSRVYPAADVDRVFGEHCDTRSLMERARRVELVTALLSGPEEFLDLIVRNRPQVVHVLAHGAGRNGFEHASWSNHDGRKVLPFPRIQQAVERRGLDLSGICLVTSGCDLGRPDVLAGLQGIGFGAVIAWPGSVCVTEARAFHTDLYESLVAQYIFHRGDSPFWESRPGCPAALGRSFRFACAALRARYELLDQHFADIPGRRDAAGYYLHTPAWSGEPHEYAAFPVLAQR